MFVKGLTRGAGQASMLKGSIAAGVNSANVGLRHFSGSRNLFQVKELTSFEDYKTLIGEEKLSIIDFYATWCGPCKAIEPIMEQLSERVPQASFARIDVDEQGDVAQDNGISAMPTIKFYKDGQVLDTVVGANLQKIVGLINQHTGVDITKQ